MMTEPEIGRLLIVDDEVELMTALREMLSAQGYEASGAASGQEALAAMQEREFDLLLTDLMMPGLDLLEKMQTDERLRDLPVIVYTGKDLRKREEARLEKLARDVILKEVHTPERLLAETALFLHRAASKLPKAQRQMLESLYQADTALAGKKALVVDDDIRNIFAMTTVLERHEMEVYSAENGKAAIDLLQRTPGISVVLMDIMMPEMDGYETMRAIRKIGKFKSLPIVALTAKAMKGDREKCIEAGASDYIAKPVNTEQLLSLLRVWLYR